ncbi:MAG: SDR family oxidoreductase [Proteobacteria bacterium]|nr:SDR family oxidoreductase [Pseudomonadota bacterium]
MKDIEGRVTVVTGAASGIGRALAVRLAAEGCALALADLDEAGLDETVKQAGNPPRRLTAHRVDVADRDRVHAFAEEVVQAHGRVDIVINNAGVTLRETIEDATYDDIEWILGINLWGVIHGSKAFLPHLRQRSEANLVNVSSVHGLFTNRNVGLYCTSKFAVRGFTMALAQELKDTPVRVSCVHPGGIKTDIVRRGRFRKGSDPTMTHDEAAERFDRYIAWTSAERAARIIIRGIRKDKPRIRVGPDAVIYDLASRLAPATWQKLMSRL